jgi:hypothetical protein
MGLGLGNRAAGESLAAHATRYVNAQDRSPRARPGPPTPPRVLLAAELTRAVGRRQAGSAQPLSVRLDLRALVERLGGGSFKSGYRAVALAAGTDWLEHAESISATDATSAAVIIGPRQPAAEPVGQHGSLSLKLNDHCGPRTAIRAGRQSLAQIFKRSLTALAIVGTKLKRMARAALWRSDDRFLRL